jgi:CHAD domain-containing protein
MITPPRIAEVDLLRKSLRSMHHDLARDLMALSRSIRPSTVHAARTSARRLRAILSGYKRFLHPAARRRYVAALREVTEQLNALRDADVMQTAVIHMTHCTADTLDRQQHGLARLMHRRRLHKLIVLKADIGSSRWSSRLTRLQRLASGPLLIAAPQMSVAAIVSRVLQRGRRRLCSALRYRGRGPRMLHKLRSKVRAMRYLLEHAQSLTLTESGAEIGRLNKMQHCLGVIHDSWVLNQTLKKRHLYPQAVAGLSSESKRQGTRYLAIYHKQRTMLLHSWRKRG